MEMESPPWKQENRRCLFCDVCGCDDFGGGDDGFFYCSQCGSQSQNAVATQADVDDMYGGDGGVGAIYSVFHHRAKGQPSLSPSKANLKLPSKEEILRSLTQSAAGSPMKESLPTLYEFEDGSSSSPQDFGSPGCRDPERAVAETRLRYVQGLQLMLQLQCEALTEKFGVSALICGMAMTIWLRYVAVSRVFDDGWVERMVEEAKIAAATKLMKKNRSKEYSKDLRTYLKYCGDVIFAGLAPSYEEGKLIERLWDLYDKKEDEDQHIEEETKFFELKVKRPRAEESTNLSMDFKEVKEEEPAIARKKVCAFSSCSTAARNAAIEQMKFDMEDNGFQYLPPRGVKRSGDYLHYRRQKTDGNLIYVAHADYYILLRACAKLAQVDARILHIGVLKFEKRLDWIEQRIDQSLNLLHELSFQAGS